jgi:hypothetical protein
MPTYSVSDIIASPAAILYAPSGTAIPDETSVAYATYASWTSWTLLGYTSAPATLTMERETEQLSVQQVLAAVREVVTAEALSIKTTLAQFDGALLAILLGGANTNTSAGAAQKAYSEVAFGGNPQLTEYAFAIEGYRVDAAGTKQPVRVFIHKGVIKAMGDITFDKAAMVGIPIEIHALANTSLSDGANLGKIHVVTAPASS